MPKASTKHAALMFWSRLKSQLFAAFSVGVTIRTAHWGVAKGGALDGFTIIRVFKTSNSIALRDFESQNKLISRTPSVADHNILLEL
jgi:hypothetical protein